MASRLLDAIQRANAKAATLPKAQLDKLNRGLKTPWKDLVQFQNLQAQAHAMGKISTEEAQVLYRIYGGESPSPEKWDRLTIGERVVGTKAAEEMIRMRMRGRNPRRRRELDYTPTEGELSFFVRVTTRTEGGRTRSMWAQKLADKGKLVLYRPVNKYGEDFGYYKGDTLVDRQHLIAKSLIIKEEPAYLHKYYGELEVWKGKNPLMRRFNPRQALYESFHGNPPERQRTVKVPIPKGPMIAIGLAERIEYVPYGSSQHTKTRFYHDFGETGNGKLKVRPILATDTKGENLFLIPQSAKYPHFSDRGIIG